MTSPSPDPQLVVDAILDARHPVKMKVADWARAALDPGDMVARDHDCIIFLVRGTHVCQDFLETGEGVDMPGFPAPVEDGCLDTRQVKIRELEQS